MTPDLTPRAELIQLQERLAALEYELRSGRQQVEAARALTEIAAELAATLDSAQVTPRVVSAGLRLLHGRLSTLYRLDPTSGSLTCVAVAGDPNPQRWIGRSLPAGMGVAARAIAAREPIVIPDILADPGLALPDWIRERAKAEDLRAVTAIPLVARGEPVGALVVVDAAGRVPGAEALPLLAAFAAQAAVALDNARLYTAAQQELTERTRTEETLARYRFLADQARDIVLCVRRDGLLLEANEAALDAYGYSLPELLGLTIRDLRATETQPFTAAQMAQADAEGILFETVHRRKDGSLFPVEVSSRGTALGGERVLVSIIRDITGRKQAQAALADQIERLEAIRAVTAEITRELDLPAALGLIVRRAVDLAGADSGTLRLWDKDAQLLVPVSWTGPTEEPGPFRLRLGEGVAGEAARQRAGLIVNDFRHSPYATARLLDLTTHAAVLAEPLVFGDRLVGVLSMSREGEGAPFTEENREILALFAGQAAIAIENARLHTAAVRRGQELEALLGATHSLMSGLDLQAILHQIVAEASQMAGTPHVSVMLVDKTAKVLQVAALVGDPMPAGFSIPLGADLSGIVAQTGEPLFSPDTPNDPRSLLADRDRELGFLTYLGLPIKVRSEVLGVLTFDTTTPRRYTLEEITYLTSFADQAAIAIEKAELFRQEQVGRQQLEVIGAIGAEMTRELDLPRLLDIIARRARDLVGASACAVWLWSNHEQLLSVKAHSGEDPWLGELRMQLGEGITGEVARRREGLIVNDYRASPFAHPAFLDRSPVRAVLAEPLLYGDRLLGVLVVNHLGANRTFHPEDRHFFRLLADHAAIAIENARLFAEVKRSYQELQRAQDELIRSEKLRALGQMAAGVAHDLNNILAAALGQVQLLRMGLADPAIQDRLATVEKAVTDGAHVVRRLQDFARRRTRIPLVPTDLAAAVQEALEITRPRWRDEPQRQGYVIEVRTALDGLPPILGHAAEVREALTNLILNAVDAMPQGGVLTVSARRIASASQGNEPPDRVVVVPDGQTPDSPSGWVELSIADTGTGMSEEVRRRIFEPFFTTKGLRGSGLGLSVVYGIMERHEGHIEVSSTLGKGTQISLRFRIASQAVEVRREERPLRLAPLRILLVDDDPTVRETVGSLLRTLGHEILEADGGAAGIARLAEGPVDLVMTDLGMPEVNGWDVARAVKAQTATLPVLLMTGWGDQVTTGTKTSDLVDRVLTKPFRLEELTRVLAELHDRHPASGHPG
jgi:PAS domain S-box-containing protein